MISSSALGRLKSVPIESVAKALGIHVERHKALCPFHDDSRPSLTFDTRRNCYRCFVCGAHGGAIDLVMKSQDWKFLEGCKWLAGRFGISVGLDSSGYQSRTLKVQKTSLSYGERCNSPGTWNESPNIPYLESLIESPSLCEEAKRFLFDERKINPFIVKRLGLTSISTPVPMNGNPNGSWFKAPSLLIPYRDIDGKLLSVQARYLGHEKDVPRFQFPRGSSCHIWNIEVVRTLKEGEELWIAEGVSDCLALLSSDRKAVAIPSATLLKAEDIGPLKDLNLHMAPDNDEPGERLFLQIQRLLPQLRHHHLPSSFKDFGEWWKNKCS